MRETRMDPFQLVHSTADAAFATADEDRIVMWNEAAEELLGYKATEVVGRPCHEVLCGIDVFGNRFCDAGCNLHRMAARRESVRRFQMDVRKASGEFIRLSISILAAPDAGGPGPTIIHMLQPVSELNEIQPAGSAGPAAAGASVPLTRREVEVLRHLAAGTGTEQIAAAMFISVATVRTHVQNILRKLEVHSKLAAVAIAKKNRLI